MSHNGRSCFITTKYATTYNYFSITARLHYGASPDRCRYYIFEMKYFKLTAFARYKACFMRLVGQASGVMSISGFPFNLPKWSAVFLAIASRLMPADGRLYLGNRNIRFREFLFVFMKISLASSFSDNDYAAYLKFKLSIYRYPVGRLLRCS